MYYTYILYSKDFDRYYVGQCEFIDIRLKRHNNRCVPSTKPYVPWEIVYKEVFATRAEAANREKEIKNKKSRKYIEYLITSK
jgi:putative endonuclease